MVALIGFNDRVFDSLRRRLERIAIDRYGFLPEFEFAVHLPQDNPFQPPFIIDKGEVFSEMGPSALLSHQGRLQKTLGRDKHIFRLNRHSEIMGIMGLDVGKEISL